MRTAPTFRITRGRGIKTACLADSLRELKRDGNCTAKCWRVACFVRHFIKAHAGSLETPHFGIEGDRPGKWSPEARLAGG